MLAYGVKTPWRRTCFAAYRCELAKQPWLVPLYIMNILLIILIVLLLGGGGWGFRSGNHYVGGGSSLLLIILIVLLLSGRL